MALDRRQLLSDVSGGLSAAVIALPLALGFGVISFGPLGDPAAGALAGLYGAIFTGIFAAIFGGTRSQVTGPTGPMTVVTTSVVAEVMKYEQAHAGPEVETARVLTLVFLCGMMGGTFQIALGLLRAGRLIKFIPYPVIAGFMNGIAVIIFLGQVKPFMGIATESPVWDLGVRPSVLMAATATVVIIVVSGKIAPRLPAGLVGLAGGTACFFLLGRFLDPELLVFEGNTLIVGEIPRALPTPHHAWTAFQTVLELDADIFRLLIPPALALGVLGAIDSLLTSLVADVATHTRHDSDRELIGQGVGNIVAGAFGGLSGAGATVRTLVNVENGGRTRLSGVVHGVALLTVLLVLGPLAGWIPMAVLAGILVVTSVKMVDQWSVQLLRKKSARADSFVVVTVTVVTVAVDLMVAVAIGLLISVVLFVREMVSHSIARSEFRGAHRRSKRVRADDEEALLKLYGSKILAYELEGSLFFGNTDTFSKKVEEALAAQATAVLILDLKRVRTVYIRGAELIKRLVDQVKDRGTEVFISSFNPYVSESRQGLLDYMKELEVISAVTEQNIFANLDDALECAEDAVLAEMTGDFMIRTPEEYVRHCVLFEELTNEEYRLIEKALEPRTFEAGDAIWKKGEPGDKLFIVGKGHVSVYISMEDHADAQFRLASFGPGRHFGDMTFLEGGPRSGQVLADSDSICYVWPRSEFDALCAKHPHVSIKLLTGLAHRLSERLRVTSAELVELED
jgi:SulP family sulfate permease